MDQAAWWRTGIVYQIYPRSFNDSNGDGIGDLAGITAKLDYLQWLGVDALWLSPIFPSPMKDFGYDVADYVGIHPMFGTLADFDHLLEQAHGRGIKILLDLVPNHTSDQHPWFIESRASRDNPKRNWYLWRDAKPDGSPPNNWLAYFGGPAWTWDAATGQYYLHNFLPEQPDLNYRNPDVLAAMLEQVRFWLDRGVDGFRIDVIDRMLKDEEFRDNPPNPDYQAGDDNPMYSQLRVYSENRPGIHQLIGEFRKLFDSYPDRVMIGEIAYSTDPTLITGFHNYENQPILHMPFNFALILLPWKAKAIRDFVSAYEAALPPDGQPNYVFGNHDMPRLASRIGAAQARVAAMLLLTLRGTPFIYQGEELGMLNGDITPEQYQDPQGINTGVSRDFERTPIHWSAAEPYAGFSTAEPWLPVGPHVETINVQTERVTPDSMLNLYRALIVLRRVNPVLTLGRYIPLDAPDDVLMYARRHGDSEIVVALNFTHAEKPITLDRGGKLVLSTHLDRAEQPIFSAYTLRPNEGIVIER
ncbi:MAG: alpha-amylase family glycosyl hydrolase [bacterium]|nr:alpha-amylase family glycosyl hydrolase [bacterium]